MKRTPIKRRARLRSRRSTQRRSSRVRDTAYMLRVKELPCAAWLMSPCGGVVEADHAGRRGLGQKCPDNETIPICTTHHRERTDFSGAFKDWDQSMMRAWLASEIAATQAVLMLYGPGGPLEHKKGKEP